MRLNLLSLVAKAQTSLAFTRLFAALTFPLSDFTFHLSPYFVRLKLGCTRCKTLKQALRFTRWHKFSAFRFPFSALTTSSFRNPLGITFSYATRDLLLPMLSNPRWQTSAFTFHLSPFRFSTYHQRQEYAPKYQQRISDCVCNGVTQCRRFPAQALL